MAHNSPSLLSDRDLLVETARVADCERHTTAKLLELLAEVDSRRLYLGEGYSSLFTYCTKGLHLSESAAYSRITAARAARRFPIVLAQLAAGDISLTTVSLLAAHLSDDNLEQLLDAARHRGKREVEELVASLHPQPPVASTLQRVAWTAHTEGVSCLTGISGAAPRVAGTAADVCIGKTMQAPSPRSVASPLGGDRYLLRITLTAEARGCLSRAVDLLRHSVPNGDPAVIVERALKALVSQLERQRLAATSRPRSVKESSASKTSPSRYIPAAIRRAVWARDGSRCAFVGSRGRCAETGFLELHHVQPFARGGPATVENLQLRCRAHNQYEAAISFGSN